MTCDACDEGENHYLKRCRVFLAWTPAKRRQHLQTKRRCFLCLCLGHGVNKCQSANRCDTCKRRHHVLLHGSIAQHEKRDAFTRHYQEQEASLLLPDRNPETDSEDESASTHFASHKISQAGTEKTRAKQHKSLRVVRVKLRNGKNTESINALVDDGTNISMLDRTLGIKLGLLGPATTLTINVAGGHTHEMEAVEAKLTLQATTSNYSHDISVQLVDNPVGELETSGLADPQEELAPPAHARLHGGGREPRRS